MALIGDYRLHFRLATGGMAEVFLASHRESSGEPELCVVKSIRPDLSHDTTFVKMLQDEAAISRYLKHPNITQLFDYGMHEGRPFLVMEYVSGVSLAHMIRHSPVPGYLVAEVGAKVASALSSAHQQCDVNGAHLGIVHRDVTPQNVMVTFDGEVKLLDFGIALARVRAEKTKTGVVKGKWNYLSPEQILEHPVDERSDIFSLGAVMFEMLTGARSFQGDSPPDILNAVLNDDPWFRAPNLNEISVKLIKCVSRCLRKEPQDRYQTAAELSKDLEMMGLSVSHPKKRSNLGQYVKQAFPKLRQKIVEAGIEAHGSARNALRKGSWHVDDKKEVREATFWESQSPSDSGELSTKIDSNDAKKKVNVAALKRAPQEPPRDRLPSRLMFLIVLSFVFGICLAVLIRVYMMG